MLKYAIPGFRLTDGAVADDIRRVTDLGVKITYNSRIDRDKFEELRKDYQYVFIGAGAQLAAPLDIEGAYAEGVMDPLEFLFCARRGDNAGIGKKVIIIGGGNTAMDAARTAHRMTGRDGSVTVVYRRTVNEMPADQGEIEEVIKEGINIIELAAPEKIITGNGKVSGLLCSRMELKGTDKSGRPAPAKIAGSEFTIPCDTIIPAIGQITDIDFVTRGDLTAGIKTGATAIPGVYTGGDIMRGASTAINAIADGRKAAWQIMTDAAVSFDIPGPKPERELTTRCQDAFTATG
jgi:putative selenate reductase